MNRKLCVGTWSRFDPSERDHFSVSLLLRKEENKHRKIKIKKSLRRGADRIVAKTETRERGDWTTVDDDEIEWENDPRCAKITSRVINQFDWTGNVEVQGQVWKGCMPSRKSQKSLESVISAMWLSQNQKKFVSPVSVAPSWLPHTLHSYQRTSRPCPLTFRSPSLLSMFAPLVFFFVKYLKILCMVKEEIKLPAKGQRWYDSRYARCCLHHYHTECCS